MGKIKFQRNNRHSQCPTAPQICGADEYNNLCWVPAKFFASIALLCINIRSTKSLDLCKNELRELYPSAYRTALYITNDASRAEDAVQEALCQAYRHIGSLRSGGSLETWLGTVVRRAAVDQVRSPSRRREVAMEHKNLALSAAPATSGSA